MSDFIEPLDIDVDLSNVDTSMPLLPVALYDLVIDDLKKEDNKDKTGHNLTVTFKTTSPIESVQGKPINPGFTLKKWFPLQPSKKENTTWDYRTGLAQLIDAAYGTTMGDRPKITDDLKGKVVRARVNIEKNKEGLDANAIGALTHPE